MFDDRKINEYGLTEKDMFLLEIMAEFNGKIFMPVLMKTFFLGKAEQTARNKITKLMTKKKLVRRKPTGLIYPKNAIILTEAGKRFVNDYFSKNISEINLTMTTLWHTIYEQITYYYLKILGKNVERTIVTKWKQKGYSHTPDLVYTNAKGKNVYVEIELNIKRPDRYLDIFSRMKKDDVGTVLYVFENDRKMKTLGTKIPIWDKIYYATIDDIIESGSKGKLIAKKQKEFLEEILK